ncbi:MAG: phosphoesterase [Lactobacillaceae bacterium]|jgi:hypothetical protein|nr:phosphoesterase [Lactobacillaceae bacterium]
MVLEYFEFYRGNLVNGFDYYYGKLTDEHAFLLKVPKTAGLLPAEVTEPTFDFNRAFADRIAATPALRQYAGMWTDTTFQWQAMSKQMEMFIQGWAHEYNGQSDTLGGNDEWGLRVKYDDNAEEQRYWGVNRYTDNFDEFTRWFDSLASRRIR